MQKDNIGNAQNNEREEAKAAIERILNGSSGEEFLADVDIVGKCLRHATEKQDAQTSVKAVNVNGVLAAKDFEDFVKQHCPTALSFERFYSDVTDSICYDLIIPRFLLDDRSGQQAFKKFSKIIENASAVDVAMEVENADYAGAIYVDVTFPAVIRS